MNKFILTLLLSTIFLFIFTIPTFATNETNSQRTTLIKTYHEDVTGDDLKEEIQLKGILFSPDSGYFHNIWADIKGPQTKQWKIVYKGGYEPELQFIDLNHDGVHDIFYQSATGGSGGLYNYQLHTLKNEKLKKLPLPESLSITGKFKDGFKVALTINPGKKPIIIDVKDRSDEYIRLGIYNKNGRLLKDTNLMIDPIAFFEPIVISKSKGYGLKSFKQVSGAYHADQLGTVESLWYFEDGKWIKLKTEWKPTGEK